MFAAPTDPNEISVAESWFRDRVPVTDEQWEALTDAQRVNAFRVAGLAQLDFVQDIFSSIADAIREGTSLGDWRDAMSQHIDTAWGGTDELPGWRLETIFRTSVQSAYGAGRYEQATDPAVADVRPIWRFSAISDSRTSPCCRAANGTTLPSDHPWWRTHLPPCHFACRSLFIALTEAQATRMGGITEKPTHVEADEGFGAPPGVEPYRPEASDYDKDLFAAFKAKPSSLRAAPPSARCPDPFVAPRP